MISVVIPIFNINFFYIENSIKSLINQSYTNFECIVIDECIEVEISQKIKTLCSTDKRFRYFHPESRIGLAKSLNMGILLAQGSWIARLDPDDICHYDRFLKQMKYLKDHPEVSVLGSSINIINNAGEIVAIRRYPQSHKLIERSFMFKNAVAHPTVIFKKDIISLLEGPYDPFFKFAEDLDLWLRLLNRGVIFANHPDALLMYRKDNHSRNIKNWIYNILARFKNFRLNKLHLRISGILFIMIWIFIPKKIKSTLYKLVIIN